MTSNYFSMAGRMINASICAYQIHEAGWIPGPAPTPPAPPVTRTVEGPDDAYFYNVIPVYQNRVGFTESANSYAPAFVASGDDYINAALVGTMDDGNVVLALRGTLPPNLTHNDFLEWIKDWAQDADVPPKPWPYLASASGDSDIQSETGFADAMESLWPDVLTMLKQAITTETTGVVITGHSKGAAMTFLAATMVAQAFPDLANTIQVYAFAAPVTGNEDFQSAYNATPYAANTHRYQVENDVVPFLPLWIDADLFAAIDFSGWIDEAAWLAFAALVAVETDGGYQAVGSFGYYNADHQLVDGAVVTGSALPAVAKTLMTGDFSTVANAHSAVDSYLPCFKGVGDK
jgi:hypothetical protein